MESVRAAVEVTAGLIPGQAMHEYTKRWFVTSQEWRKKNHRKTVKEAQAYALELMESGLNWVRVDWIYF